MKRLLILTLFFCGFVQAQTNRAPWPDGIATNASQLKALKFKADRRDARAQYEYGRILDAKNLPDKYAEASDYITKAANAGCVEAQLFLAKRYQSGHRVPQDLSTAEKYFRMAADRNSSEAMIQLAHICLTQYPGNRVDAAFWLRKAAAMGNKEAMKQMGDFCLNSIGRADFAGAFDWYEKAEQFPLMVETLRSEKASSFELYKWARVAELTDHTYVGEADKIVGSLSPGEVKEVDRWAKQYVAKRKLKTDNYFASPK